MTTVREISAMPGALGLYAKAVAGGFTRKGGDLPTLEIAYNNHKVDLAHLAEYCRICGFTVRDTLPSTYLHILTNPLQMVLMTDKSFPFALMGLVHVRNRIEQLRPVKTGEVLNFRTRVGNLQPHDKGITFDLISEAFVGSEKVWADYSTYLRRQATGQAEAKGEKKGGEKEKKKGGEGEKKEGDAAAGDKAVVLAEGPDGVVFCTLPNMVANMQAGDGRPTYLKLKVTLEAPDQETADLIQPAMPRLQDMFQSFLRELRPEDLQGSQGNFQLKAEILRRVNLVIAPAKVKSVLIEEMLIS